MHKSPTATKMAASLFGWVSKAVRISTMVKAVRGRYKNLAAIRR